MASVVHKNVHAAELRAPRGHEFLRIGGPRQIGDDKSRFASRGSDFFRRGSEFGLRARGQKNRSALSCKELRDRAPDAAA